jgi:hypothetical protein
MVLAFIASLNVTVMAAVVETPVAPSGGVVERTDGGVWSRVVKWNENGVARPFPARSFAPVVTVTVISVKLGIGFAGMNSAARVATVYVTVPGMRAPVVVTFMLNVVVLIVAGFIGSLNVTFAVPNVETTVVPFNGMFDVTRGGVTSRVVTVDAGVSAEASDSNPEVQFADTLYL